MSAAMPQPRPKSTRYQPGKTEPKFLIQREGNHWKLQKDGLDHISQVLKTFGFQRVIFIGTVGPRSCGKTETVLAMRSFLNYGIFIESDAQPIRENREGILILSTTSCTYAVSKDTDDLACVLALDIWAPNADSESYALLIDLMLLICSHVVYLGDVLRTEELVWPGPKTAITNTTCHALGIQKQVHIVFKGHVGSTSYGLTEFKSVQDWVINYIGPLKLVKAIIGYWDNTKLYSLQSGKGHTDYLHDIFSQESGFTPVGFTIPVAHYDRILRNAVDQANNPRSLHILEPKTPLSVPESVAEEIRVAITLPSFQHAFTELTDAWDKVLFLDDATLRRDYADFVHSVAKHIQPSQTCLEFLRETIADEFEQQFQDFKGRYAEKYSYVTELGQQIDLKLRVIEQDFKRCFRQGSSEQFKLQISQRYAFDLGVLLANFPKEDCNMIPQVQLRMTRLHDVHKAALLSALQVLEQIEKSLEEAFAKHIFKPETVPVPTQPILSEMQGDFKKIQPIADSLEEFVIEKYNNMLQISRSRHSLIQGVFSETEKALQQIVKRMGHQMVISRNQDGPMPRQQKRTQHDSDVQTKAILRRTELNLLETKLFIIFLKPTVVHHEIGNEVSSQTSTTCSPASTVHLDSVSCYDAEAGTFKTSVLIKNHLRRWLSFRVVVSV